MLSPTTTTTVAAIPTSSLTINSTSPFTVVSTPTDAITTADTTVLPSIVTSAASRATVINEETTTAAMSAVVTRDSIVACHSISSTTEQQQANEEYHFITAEALQDVMTVQKALNSTTDIQHHQQQLQQNSHHQHHQSSALSQLTATQHEEVAVINVVVPMDTTTDGSSNEALATMDTLAALNDGVVDLATHHHHHHTLSHSAGNSVEVDEHCPQFITVTVQAQDAAGQNYQVQYVDAEQLYQANATQTQLSYPFCPVHEYQTSQQTFYTTTSSFDSSAAAHQLNADGANLMPYLLPLEDGMLLNTSSEDIQNSPPTPNSSSNNTTNNLLSSSGCLANNSSNEQDNDDNSLENEHIHLMSGAGAVAGAVAAAANNKIASATIKWLSQNYETAEGVSLPRSTLYNHYMQHCNEHKIEPVNAASFGKLIRSVFTGLRTRRLGTRGNSKYHYYGIRIKPDSVLKQMPQEDSETVASAYIKNALDANTNNDTALDSSAVANNNSSHSINASNRPFSKKLHLKPEAYETCVQFLGDGAGAIPQFPSLEWDHSFPSELTAEDVELFCFKYKEHCEKFLDAIVNLQFATIEYLWREFWSIDLPSNENYLSKSKLQLLCLSTAVQNFVREIDYQFFQNMVDVIIPDVLRSIPNALTQAIRTFAKSMELWLCESMLGIPEQMLQIKTAAVAAFCQTLRRYTSLNHLAQAARAVLQNNAQNSQMVGDLSRVDFKQVQEQAAWVCQCEAEVVQHFENGFKLALQQKSSLEQWASWLQMVVDAVLEEHRGKPSYAKAARQFLLKWSFYSSMVIRDLTLRSAPSFGSFHLIRLLYDEYMFYLIEHKIAEAQSKTTIEIICDRTPRKDIDFELDYQFELIPSDPMVVVSSDEPDLKRMKQE